MMEAASLPPIAPARSTPAFPTEPAGQPSLKRGRVCLFFEDGNVTALHSLAQFSCRSRHFDTGNEIAIARQQSRRFVRDAARLFCRRKCRPFTREFLSRRHLTLNASLEGAVRSAAFRRGPRLLRNAMAYGIDVEFGDRLRGRAYRDRKCQQHAEREGRSYWFYRQGWSCLLFSHCHPHGERPLGLLGPYRWT